MNMKQKIFQQLVNEGKQKTAAQLAAQYKTTESTIKSRISDIRREGTYIRSERRVDSNGRVKTFYRYDDPISDLLAMVERLQKMIK